MKTIKNYPQGTFSWADLMTPNLEASKKFYSSIFGWSSEDFMWPEDMDKEGVMYSMQMLGEHSVAGMGPMMDQNMPPHWSSYVSVDNVEDTVAKVKEHGGTVVMEPMDVMDSGKMAVIQDPTGAYLSIWQAGNHIGAQHCNEINSMVWNDLGTSDVNMAKDFYSKVFGWEYEKMAMDGEQDDMDYHVILNQGRYNGGIFKMPEFMGDVPSNWSVYFRVENIDNAKQTVIDNGGKVVMENDHADVGPMAMISDPHGAMFWILQANKADEIPDSWCE